MTTLKPALQAKASFLQVGLFHLMAGGWCQSAVCAVSGVVAQALSLIDGPVGPKGPQGQVIQGHPLGGSRETQGTRCKSWGPRDV